MEPGSELRLVLVDGNVDGANLLLAGLEPGFTPVTLTRADIGGLAAVSLGLAGHAHIKSLHILSHGAPGSIALSAGSIDASCLRSRPDLVARIAEALADDADVVLYGCSIASGRDGEAFVDLLSRMLGRPVEAAPGPVGSSDQGGSWSFLPASRLAFGDLARTAYPGVLAVATFGIVTTINTSTTLTSNESGTTISVTKSDGVAMNGVSSGFLDPGVIASSVSYTLTFSSAVDITQFQIGEFANLSSGSNYVFTPDSGTALTIADNSGSIVGSIATLTPADWSSVTSMTVSYEGSADWRLGLDNIVFASATPTDTTPPTVSAPDLLASSDTGVSSTDNITDDATPTFAGTAEAGSFVSLLVNGVTVASGVAATGTGAWTLTAGSLSAGSYFVQAKATDAAGNVATSAGLGVTVTSFAPAPTLSAPDLVASSDSGISSTDNLTNVTSPEFVGTAAAGSTVSLLVNGVTASAAVANSVTGAWTLSAGSLASGSYFIQAEGSDGFGGTTTSSGIQVVIDTVAPTVSAPDLVASSDTGASSTDNVTEDATPTFTGTAEAGSFVSLLVNGVTVAGGIAATGTGAWTLTAGSLTAGSYFVQTSAQDAAGNTATSAGLGVTVEAPPPPPVSGIATFGVVTTLNTTTTLTSNESGLSISVTQSDGSAMAGVSSGFLDPGVIDASVSYSLSFSQAISISQLQIGEFLNLSSGSNYVFTPDSGTALTIADNSGSIVGAIATLTPADWSSVTSMTVSYEGSADWRLGLDNIVFASATPTDTTPPTVSAPDLLASSDTGVSSTDNITDDATPTFAGTAEAGSFVSLLVNGVTVASGVAATGAGAWTLTAGSLSAGSYFVQAKATDAAGNVATSAGLGVTVTSFAPAPTLSAPDLVASSDSGISSTDNLTNVTSPEFVGTAAAGSTVSLLVNGVTASAAVANSVTGAWTLSAGSLASGSYFIQAEGSDGFGGTTTSSGVQIVVDTVAPTVSAPDLVASSDTGASSTDNITEDTTPTFTGTAEAGSFVSLLVNGVTVAGGVAATGTGAWTLTAGSLTAGSYVVQTSAQDAAGNAATSSGLGIEIAGTSVPGIIFGTTAGDVITGTAGADTISALGGNDTVTGLSGNDLIFGGQGADILSAGAGFDTVYGGDGNDTLVNNASISTEAGLDVLYGGDGDDLIVNNGPASQLFGGDGADTISGGYAGDLIEGGAGADVIDGAAGFNTASYANSDAGVSVNLSDGSAESGGHAQGDTLSNINSLIGSDYSDTLIADGGQSVISAGGGDDLISHGGGRDTLWGGAGNDTFEGSLTDFTNGINTDDAIGDYASGDVIRITGTSLSASQISLSANGATGTYLNIDSDSNGSDDVTINVTGVFTGAVVTAVGGDTEITLNTSGVVSEPASVIVGTTASEVITGTPGDDTISALSGSDTVSGLSGDDMIFAGAGSDIVSAGAGADTVSGGDDADLLYGQDGDDVLSGGGGFDTLSGGAGNDSLYADDNSDQMYGGAGDDRFYVPGSTVFAGVRSYGVTDFSGGEDTIVLSGATSAQILGSFTLGADRLLEIDLDGNSSTDMYLNVGSAADAFETVAGDEGVEIVATAVDSTPPTVSAPDLIAFNDSGISNTDNLTNVTTPTFTGTAEAGAFVSLLVDGVTVSGGVAFTLFGGTLSAGGWTLSAASLSQGSHFIQAVATDAAGNSTTSAGIQVVIDTTAPTVSAPDLVASSDTGASSTDNITEDTTPTFAGTGEVGSEVHLLINGNTASGGVYVSATGSYTLTAPTLAAGSYFIEAIVRDAAGNSANGPLGLSVTIEAADTTPPTVSAPDLVAFSDSGISSTDNLTNATFLGFEGTAEAGATVNLLIDGVTSGSAISQTLFAGGTLTAGYSIVFFGTLSDGTHFVQAVATDSAGNSTTSSGLEIVIDRTAPTVSAPDLVASSDTGASSTDNITEDTTPTFSGTAEAGSVVSLLVNGVTAAGGIAATGTGAWTLTAGSLAAGSYFVQTSAQDAAGNVTTSAGLGVVIGDTTPPTVSAPDLLAFSDSGVSSTDNLTNATVLGFQGTTEAGAAVSLLVDGVTVSSGTAITLFGGTLTAGAWTLSAFSLSEGSHFVQAVATDAAGNSTTSSGLEIVIDRTAPTVSAPDLVAGSDTGASSTDNLTEDTTPTFTGTAEAGSVVSLLVNGVTVAGGIAATGTGAWTLTAGSLAAGSYVVQTSAQDAAGNVATSSGLGVTIGDTTPPTVSAPDLVAFRDSGISSTDNLTNASVLDFEGTAEAGSFVNLLIDGVTSGSAIAQTLFGGGTLTAGYSIWFTGTLSEGTHFVQAVATDAAGNSTTSSGLEIVIDRTAPTVNAPDLVASSDTGVSDTDNVTSVATPTFNGTVEAGSQVTLLIDGVTAGSTAVFGAEPWSITAATTLSAGTHFVQAEATDAAGNTTTSAGLTVTITTDNTVTGTGGDDTFLSGTSDADLILGFSGNDQLFGGAGNDTLSGGDGDDGLSGGLGDDLLVGGADSFGDAANYLGETAGVNANLATGLATDGAGGSDTLSQIEHLWGSAHDDTLIGDGGDNNIQGNAGNDSLVGGGGNDALDFFNASTGVIANLATGTVNDGQGGIDTVSGFEAVYGSSLNDLIIGGTVAENLNGNKGADTISAGDGDDFLAGDRFNSTIGSADVLSGGAGNDALRGDAGGDTLAGGSGNDFFFGTAADLNGDVITDFNATGSGEDDQVQVQNEVLTAGDIALSDDGVTTTVTVSNTSAGVISFSLTGVFTGVTVSDDGLNSYLRFVSGQAITGTAGDDFLSGTAGNDLILGLGGNDNLLGVDGDDTLSGGAGSDILRPGLGADIVDGGGSSDAVSYEEMTGGVSVDLTTGLAVDGGGSTDTLSGIEGVLGSAGDDTIDTGSSGYAFGRGGDDVIDTGGFVNGGSGADTINADGGGFIFLSYDDDGFDSQGAGTLGVSVDLANGTATDNWGYTDTLTGRIWAVAGSSLNDTITGTGDTDFEDFVATLGNDTYDLGGGFGFERVTYADTNYYSAGAVTMTITGIDTVTVTKAAGTGTDTITGFGTDGTRLRGTAEADTYSAAASLENLGGGQGYIEYDPWAGDDTLIGTADPDMFERLTFQNGATSSVDLDLSGATASTYTVGGVTYTLTLSDIEQVQTRHIGTDDTITGNADNNSFRVGGGSDSIDGGAGSDELRYSSASGNVEINLTLSTGQVIADGFGGSASIASIERFRLGSGDDTVIGSTVDEFVRAGGGADVLSGGGGNDTLSGGSGGDTLVGGLGDDRLIGGSGADTLVGGVGSDLFLAGDGDRIEDLTADDAILVSGVYSAGDLSASFDGSVTTLSIAGGPSLTLVGDFSGTVFDVSDDGAGTTIAIAADTTPPTVSAPDLLAFNDSGVSSTDNLTNASVLGFQGTTEAGAFVSLLVDGVTVSSGTAITLFGGTLTAGAWTLSAFSLSEGSHFVQAVATDAAGNSTTSSGLEIVIDRTAPTVSAPDLVASSDTGASSTDNITEDATPTFTGTAEAGSVVSLLVNGVTVAGGIAATGTGAWTLTAGSLAAGSYVVQASAQDAAGNVTTSSGLGVTIGDTTPPTVSAPDLLAFNDSGVSSTDNLTNASVLGFQGATEVGAFVSLLVDGVTVSSGTAITLFGGTLTAGAWTLSAFSLSEGSHFVQAVATDAAGNSTTSSGLEIVIDRTAPTVNAPDLVASSDTGASSTDNITEDTTPTFTGTAEAGSFVSLLVNGVTVAGGIAATGTGAWTLTAGSLAAGSYFVQTSAQDAAGNVATSAGLGVVIGDTTPPTVSAPDLVAFSDSGVSSADNLTNATVLGFQGTTEAGAAVSLLVDGVTVSSGTAITLFGGTLTAGAWTLSAFSLSEGSHFVQAVATDAAGNSTTSSGLEIVIDRTAPTVNAPDLVASSDTGASSTDNITEDTTPTFTGTAEAGSFVSLLVNGVTVAGGIAATGTGAWTLTAGSLAAGSYFVQTSAQDAAGNVTTSAGLGVVIGTGATSGADTLVGTSAGDTIDGLAGDDLISGLAGNDLLIGNDGSDTLSGGANADTLSGGTGADLVVGGGGFDVIMVSGTEGEFDTISGGAGTDTLASSTGDIVLDGFGAAEQIEVIDSASGTLRGNANANLFDLSSVTWAAAAGTVLAGFGDDTVIGTAQDDSLHGEDGADALSGGAGFDLLVGGIGDDTLVGGAQADTLSGGAGVDSIVAGGGFDVILVGGTEDAFDTLLGGAGTDTLRSTSGDIVLDGFGAANEIEVIDSATGAVLGTSGANLLDLSSVVWASAVGSVSGGGGDDTLIGTGGDDGLFGGDGNDLLSGGAGFDLLVGGSGSDTLIGGGQADTLSGGEGADSIVGSGGFDLFMVNGSEGIGDTLVGGAGTDTLRSSTGDIVLDGFGSAEQIEVIDAASGFVVGTDGDNLFDLSAVSWAAGTGGISGGEGADSLYGTGGDDSLFGDNGNDLLSGGAGFDLLVGGSGSDTLIGGGQADTLSGGEGADTLSGSGGFDLMVGGDGDDLLDGGAGSDTLSGGTGADTFVAGQADRIEDFTNQDAIQVSGVFGSGDISTGIAAGVTTLSISGGPDIVLVGDYSGIGFEVSDDGTNTTIILDSTPPTVSAPDLIASSDTGTPDNDVTEDATPTFAGTAEAGSTVNLLVNGATVASTVANSVTGTWTLTSSSLAGGTYNVQAEAEDAAGNIATSTGLSVTVVNSGSVIDGYVAGATVFADTNGNLTLDAGEVSATTDVGGNFTIAASGPLVSFGGTDISTGLAFDGLMSAPAGYTVVTPVTTLVERLVTSGGAADTAAAETQVRTAFGIDGSVDLASFDPIAQAIAGNAAANAVVTASVVIQSTLALSAALVAGASGQSEAAAYDAAARSLAAAMTADPALDLTDTAAIQSVVSGTATQLGVTDPTALANVATASAGTAQIIAGLNATTLTVASSGTQLVTDMAQVTVVANGDAADAVETAGSTGTTEAIGAAVDSYTGSNLSTAIDAAEVGDIDGGEIGGDADDLIGGTGGNDVIDGGGGNDTLRGFSGDDVISGGDGADRVLGNRGDDTLYGGAGEDFVHGGKGDDVLIVNGTGDVYDDLHGGWGEDTLRSLDGDIVLDGFAFDSIEVIDSATGVLRGTADANFMYLNGSAWFEGTGTVAAGDGNDWVVGTGGGDTLLGEGDNDRLFGGGGGDSIVGGDGDDFMLGNFGDDTIVAGGGDFAHGGLGDDVIRFDGLLAGDRADLNGGFGDNVLELALTAAQLSDASVQDDLADLDRWIDRGSRGTFDFDSLNLRLRAFDDYTLI